MSGRRRLAIGAAALLGVGMVALWLLWSGAARRSDILDRLALEGGQLGGRPIAAAVRVELGALLDLLEQAGHPRPQGPRLAGVLPGALPLAGIDLARDVRTALVLVPQNATIAELGLVLLGRFEPERVQAALRERGAEAGAASVMRLRHLRATDCRETRWGVAVDSDRVVVAPGTWIDALLGDVDALLDGHDPGGALSAIRDRAAGQRLLTASVSRVPRVDDAGDAALPALLALISRWTHGAQHARVRLDSGGLAGALELRVELELPDSATAAARAAELGAASRAAVARLAALDPALQAWNDVVGIRARGSRVHLTATRSRDAVPELYHLPRAAILLAAATQVDAGAAGETGSEVDPWPMAFVEHYALESVPDYQSGMPLAGAADTTAGPFGIRVERVSRVDADAPLEVTLRAVGPEIPNLPGPAQAPRLIVDALEDRDGVDLREPARCGSGRPEAATPLERQPLAEIRQARQTLWLRPGVGIDAVARVAGRVELDLPTRVRRVRVSGPEAGQRLETGAGEVELIAVLGSSFAYRTRGDTARLIAMRGLDSRGRPLLARDGWERMLPGGEALLGVRQYAGGLAYVEAVFALETDPASFPFALASARPGTDGEALHVESSSFVRYSPEQFDEEFARAPAERWPEERRFVHTTSAGPFRVALSEMTHDGSIAPRFRVLAPDVPNLTYDAGGLELVVHRIRLADGSTLTPQADAAPWRRFLVPGYARHGRGLEAGVQIDTGIASGRAEVSRIEGEIVLRLAHDVASAELGVVEPGQVATAADVGLTLLELRRDRLRVRLSGPVERLFSLRAFGAHGQELALADVALHPGAGPLELEVEAHGQPHRIAVQTATSRARLSRAFVLDLPAATAPAASAP